MKIYVTAVFVDDQDKALQFYTNVLGFVKKGDTMIGDFKWLTVISPEDPDGTELLLESNDNPAAQIFQQSLFEQGIPLKSFVVESVQNEYERLTGLGVKFRIEPIQAGSLTLAVFDDTCGNLLQIVQMS